MLRFFRKKNAAVAQFLSQKRNVRISSPIRNSFCCLPAGKQQLCGRCAKRSCRFPAPSRRKIVDRPWSVKKKASDHMFINLGFASADNYMWSETFLILLVVIYYLITHDFFCILCDLRKMKK